MSIPQNKLEEINREYHLLTSNINSSNYRR